MKLWNRRCFFLHYREMSFRDNVFCFVEINCTCSMRKIKYDVYDILKSRSPLVFILWVEIQSCQNFCAPKAKGAHELIHYVVKEPIIEFECRTIIPVRISRWWRHTCIQLYTALAINSMLWDFGKQVERNYNSLTNWRSDRTSTYLIF